MYRKQFDMDFIKKWIESFAKEYGASVVYVRMKALYLALALCATRTAVGASSEAIGPDAALRFSEKYRGDEFVPGVLHCYPKAAGIPFADTPSIIQMHSSLWRPRDIVADFNRRIEELPVDSRKKGIIVVLKTERCATKAMRLCSVTTAALAKQSAPAVGEFAIYGLQLKPRDGDEPPGSLLIEEGDDAWKNAVAGEYGFRQGPGATIVILSPLDGSKIQVSDAFRLRLFQEEFVARGGETPELEGFLRAALRKLEEQANQSQHRNAGSRPSSGAASASETPSPLGSRGRHIPRTRRKVAGSERSV
jgi:hypothetical protein